MSFGSQIASEKSVKSTQKAAESKAPKVSQAFQDNRPAAIQRKRVQEAVAVKAPKNVLQRQEVEPEISPSGTNEASTEAMQAFIAKHGHAHLLQGIDPQMSETEIIGKLIDNFFARRDFTYNFSSVSTFSGKGDCSTLSQEFVQIAKEVFGIENIQTEGGSAGYFIAGGGRIVHSSDVTGNIDQGAHWYFETHTWVVWNGKPIDVLFGQLGVVGHQPGVKSDYKDGSVSYTVGNVRFYLKKNAQSEFDRYTSDASEKLTLP